MLPDFFFYKNQDSFITLSKWVIFFVFRIWRFALVLVSDGFRFCFILLSYGLILMLLMQVGFSFLHLNFYLFCFDTTKCSWFWFVAYRISQISLVVSLIWFFISLGMFLLFHHQFYCLLAEERLLKLCKWIILWFVAFRVFNRKRYWLLLGCFEH